MISICSQTNCNLCWLSSAFTVTCCQPVQRLLSDYCTTLDYCITESYIQRYPKGFTECSPLWTRCESGQAPHRHRAWWMSGILQSAPATCNPMALSICTLNVSCGLQLDGNLHGRLLLLLHSTHMLMHASCVFGLLQFCDHLCQMHGSSFTISWSWWRWWRWWRWWWWWWWGGGGGGAGVSKIFKV